MPEGTTFETGERMLNAGSSPAVSVKGNLPETWRKWKTHRSSARAVVSQQTCRRSYSKL